MVMASRAYYTGIKTPLIAVVKKNNRIDFHQPIQGCGEYINIRIKYIEYVGNKHVIYIARLNTYQFYAWTRKGLRPVL